MTRGKPTSLELRKRIIVLHNKTLSLNEIAKRLLVSRSTVQYVITNYGNTKSLQPKKRTGRKQMTTPADNRILNRIILEDRRATTVAIKQKWQNSIGKSLSTETCRRRLKTLGYNYYTAKEKPLLTERQKKNRLAWAKTRKDWVQRQWDQVIFSDESRFTVSVGNEKNVVIRKKNEAYNKDCLKRTVKFPASVMVWGCMSARGLGNLKVVDGIVNAKKYQVILENDLIPSIDNLFGNDECIFQQDGASCHTARTTKQWFESHDIELLPWPASSPDLSPIETIWGIMKKKLKNERPATKDDLILKLHEVWNSITPDQCQELYRTMNDRVGEVIKNRGDVTKY